LSALVLDASALLAFIQDEDGASEVEEALANGASMSTANLAEVLSKLAERGKQPREAVAELESAGLLGGLIAVEPLTLEDAITIAELFPATREHGLGLGDRACLALGRRLRLPVMTADAAWVQLENEIGADVHAFRG
jgi:ribonuclease VapC